MPLPLDSGKRISDDTGNIFIPANGSRKGLILVNRGSNTVHFSFHKNPAVIDNGFSLDIKEKAILQGVDTFTNELRMICAATETSVISFEEI